MVIEFKKLRNLFVINLSLLYIIFIKKKRFHNFRHIVHCKTSTNWHCQIYLTRKQINRVKIRLSLFNSVFETFMNTPPNVSVTFRITHNPCTELCEFSFSFSTFETKSIDLLTECIIIVIIRYLRHSNSTCTRVIRKQ